MRILKYAWTGPDPWILVPAGAYVMHVAEQRGVLTVWCQAFESAPLTTKLLVLPTGADIDYESRPGIGRHVGSAVCAGGDFVWHLFEEIGG